MQWGKPQLASCYESMPSGTIALVHPYAIPNYAKVFNLGIREGL